MDFNSVKELVNQLDEQIRQSTVVLVIGGMYCNYRKWIQKEIEIQQRIFSTKKLGKNRFNIVFTQLNIKYKY